MLVDPILNINHLGHLGKVLAAISGGETIKRIARGLYTTGNWNFDDQIILPVPFATEHDAEEKHRRYSALPWDMQYPNFPCETTFKGRGHYVDERGIDQYEEDRSNYLGTYGVCDSPDQFIEYAAGRLDVPDRFFVVSFVCIERSGQPESGGWRYHKWGDYIGQQNPQSEYLYHDTHIERVYTYHIYELPAGQFFNHEAPEVTAELRRCYAMKNADMLYVLNA